MKVLGLLICCVAVLVLAQGEDDVCSLPAETGPCRGLFRKYAYEKDLGKCQTFVYGGCQGNGNNFDSLEACEDACGKGRK